MTALINLPVATIDFEPEGHIYTLNGRRLPSVTQIMECLSLMLYRDVPPDVMATAADRGTRAHEQISNYIRFGIMEPDDDTEPYLTAFRAFEEAYRPVYVASEYRTYHTTMRYAGTLDMICYVSEDDGSGYDVVDLKCTRVFHSIMLATQLAGYAEALKSHGIPIRNRYGLQLLKDGTYRFEKVKEGYQYFLHCLALWNAMAEENRP